jgi:hypothetical protein
MRATSTTMPATSGIQTTLRRDAAQHRAHEERLACALPRRGFGVGRHAGILRRPGAERKDARGGG